jgi:hypothetical protein
VYFLYIHRLKHFGVSIRGKSRQVKAPSLAYGIGDDAPVFSKNPAGAVNKGAFLRCPAGIVLYKGGVIAAGDKAYILAVLLAGVAKALFPGYVPHVVFGKFSQGEQGMGKLFLGEAVQKIALILFFVQGFFKEKAVPVFFYAGIVAGNDIVKIKLPGPAEEAFKFDITVTVYAGIRGEAVFVGPYKTAYDLLFEFGRKVKHIVGHAYAGSYVPGVPHIAQGAA